MSNADFAFNWLVQRGYAPHQAAAIVGNLTQESNVRPDGVVGDNGTAFGVAQWRGDRFAGLQRYAQQQGTDWRDLGTQLGYLDHELNTTEKSAGEALRAAPDVRSATRAFIGFERPQGWTAANPEAGHGWQNRFAVAQKYAGGAPAGTPAPTSPYSPPAMPAAPTAPASDSLGSALALLGDEGTATPTIPVMAQQTGPFMVDDSPVDTSIFQPRTTKRGKISRRV